MKRYLLLPLLLVTFNTFCIKNRYSQTIMFTRPCYFDLHADQAAWHNIIYCNEPCKSSSFQVIAFYQKSFEQSSTKKSRKLSEYFLMRDKHELTVKGSAVDSKRDILADWLRLPSDFDGSFTIFPEQKQAGFTVDYKQDLKSYSCPDSFWNNFWVGASISFASVENHLNFKEESNYSRMKPSNPIYDSLNRNELEFGKFKNRSESTGFSEIRAKLGTEYLSKSDFQINTHSYVMFPLISKPTGKEIFEAIRGFNGHLGLGTVLNFQIPLTNEDAPCLIALYLDVEGLYLFRNKQHRTFEIRNKPFSRFMLLINKDDLGTKPVPAVNILTQKVKVSPYIFVDLSTGFRFKLCNWEGEVGYELFAHPDEKVKFHKKFPKGWGIANAVDIATASADDSIISEIAPADPQFIDIPKNHLNKRTAQARAAITHQANAEIGYTFRGNCCNGLFALGGFAEFAQNNAALSNWGFWGKFGITF